MNERGGGGHELEPGRHGGEGARLAASLGVDRASVLDLSMSLNPLAAPIAPLAARHLDGLAGYPDPGAVVAATEALAAAMSVEPDRLVLTNGGAEAIALVANDMGAGWVDDPDFSLYRRHLRTVEKGAPRWRSNPHSPSGRLALDDDTATVWDEAFYPLATGRWTRGDPQSIVVGSLTKTFACPGLRMGYVLSRDGDLVQRLRRRQPQWSVGALALAVLPELLATADLRSWCDGIAELRRRLAELLEANGWRADAADANWVLVPGAGDLRAKLAARGIAVRDCTSFGLPNTVRIAVPDADGLERLATALDRITA